jgi:hypothetical protein
MRELFIVKIEIRLEDGKPIIFFTDVLSQSKNIQCYSMADQHNYASRGYMRSLPIPETCADILASWETLGRYAAHVAYTMKL